MQSRVPEQFTFSRISNSRWFIFESASTLISSRNSLSLWWI